MGKQVKKKKVYTLNQVGIAMAFYSNQTDIAIQNCYHLKPEELPEEYRVSKHQLIGMFINLSALQSLCIGMLQMGLKDTETVVPNDKIDPFLEELIMFTAKDAERYEDEQVAMKATLKMGVDKTIN